MFKKLLSWFQAEPKPTETDTSDSIPVAEEKPLAPSVAAALKKAVDDQITDAVTAKPKKPRRRKPKARRPNQNNG